jgi:ribosomal protein S18 acetylase RimI-like enzyme
VRAGATHDALDAARLHARHIPTGFLTVLGPRLLTRLYRRVARADDCFLLVAEADGATVGFLAGSVNTAALFRRFIVLDGPAVVLASGWAVLRHWRHALETLSGAGPRQPAVEPDTDEPMAHVEAELLAVAVEDGWRGSGLGSTLTRQFLGEAWRRGAGSARVVVGATNHEAVKMYEHCGFTTVEQFEHHRGTASLLMRCQLVPQAAESRCGPATPE